MAGINPRITESANNIIHKELGNQLKLIMLNKCNRSKISLPFHQGREP